MFKRRRERREAQMRAQEQLEQARIAEIKAAEEQDAEKNAHLHELQVVLAELIKDNADLEKDRDSLEEELQAVRTSMRARLSTLEQQLSMVNAELKHSNEQADSLHAKLQTTDSELTALRNSARQSETDYNAQISTLTQQVEEARREANDLGGAHAKSSELANEVMAVSAERDRFRDTVNELEAQLEAAADIAAEDQHAAEQLQAHLESERDAAIQREKDRTDVLEANIVVVSSELESKKMRIVDLERSLNNVNRRTDLEKAELLSRIEQLQADLDASQNRAKELEDSTRKWDMEARELVAREKNATSELEELKSQLEMCESDRKNLQEALKASVIRASTEPQEYGTDLETAVPVSQGLQDSATLSEVAGGTDGQPAQMLLFETQMRSQQRSFNAEKRVLENRLEEKIFELDSIVARQVAVEAELSEHIKNEDHLRQRVGTLESECARLTEEKIRYGDEAKRLLDELSDYKVAEEFGGAAASPVARGVHADQFANYTFEIIRKVEVTFEDERMPLGVGLAQMARGSELTVIRTLNEGTKSKPTGAGVHNKSIRDINEDMALELGMVLIGINRISTVNMSYEDVITAIKRLPKPISLLFAVIQQKKALT